MGNCNPPFAQRASPVIEPSIVLSELRSRVLVTQVERARSRPLEHCSYHVDIAVWRTNGAQSNRVNYWEIIADKLSKAGWSSDCVSTVDFRGRTIFVADAHRDDAKRFVVRADERLTVFVEMESAILLGA